LPDDEDVIVGMVGDQLFRERHFSRVLGSNAKAVPFVGIGIGSLLVRRQGESVFGAKRLGDVAPVLQGLPGYVVALGADEREDVIFVAVLPDESGSQAKSPLGLDAARGPEYGGWQHVDLVVDDEPPIALLKELEVLHGLVLRFSVGKHLVGGDGNGLHVLYLACVFTDGVGVDGGFRQELVPPLVNRDIIGRDDQGARRNLPQDPEADDRLARPAGEHDNPTTPGCATGVVEGLDRVGLVVA